MEVEIGFMLSQARKCQIVGNYQNLGESREGFIHRVFRRNMALLTP